MGKKFEVLRFDRRTDDPKIGKSNPDVKPTDVNTSNDGGCRAKVIRGYVQCVYPVAGMQCCSKGIGEVLSHLRGELHVCGHLMR